MSTEGVMSDADYLDDGDSWRTPIAYSDDQKIGVRDENAEQGDVDWLLQQINAGRVNPAVAAKELRLARTLKTSTVDKARLGYSGNVIGRRYIGSSSPYRFQFQNYLNIETPSKFYSPKWGESADTGMVVLPVPPETMEVSGGNAPEEVVSASGITFSHAGAYTPLTFTLEGFFPNIIDANNVPDYVPVDSLRRGIYTPRALCSKFTKAMRAGQPIVFNVVQPNNLVNLMDTHTVVITDFSWSFRAGHGQDRFWSMTLREWFPQRMIQTGRKPGKGTQGATKPVRPPVPANSVYTIKTGDTLSGISDRLLGNAGRWREIYDLNKEVIEKAARDHGATSSAGGGSLPLRTAGWWIFPGTKLQIPAK